MKQLETVSLSKIVFEWQEIKRKVPSYRLGQHFINRCFHSDKGFGKLWNADASEAGVLIGEVLTDYNWSALSIPVVREVNL